VNHESSGVTQSCAEVSQKLIHNLGWLILASWCVMVLGSLVRATDSGLACPDWPLCFDQPIPLFDTQIFLEWFHRVIAALLSIGTALVAIRVVRHRQMRGLLVGPLFLSLVLLVWQIVLGALTVLRLLQPGIVSWHLINAVAFLGLLIWMREKCIEVARPWAITWTLRLPMLVKTVLKLVLVAVFLQIFMGGMVSSSHAGLMCPDFPKCFGLWLPNLGPLVTLQMAHRFTGFFIVGMVVFLLLATRRIVLPIRMRHCITSLPPLMALQVLLGALNIVWKLPTWASVAHLAVALIIFAVIMALNGMASCIASEQTFAYEVTSKNEALMPGRIK
jgi:heme a synthase